MGRLVKRHLSKCVGCSDVRLIVLLCCLLLEGCTAIPSPAIRLGTAEALAAGKGWASTVIKVGDFELIAYVPSLRAQEEVLTVYLEGDGFAWISRSLLSENPTPIEPIALMLALAQPTGSSAYLARPCQFVTTGGRFCDSSYWSEARFSPEVVAATSAAIDELKKNFKARLLVLVGYSGGGGLAALVAAQRSDVKEIVTVVGNLDPNAWTALHKLDPLTKSLNPIDYISQLIRVRQRHLVGTEDRNIPPKLLYSFADRFPTFARPEVIEVPGYDHRCCWSEAWPSLWQKLAK